MVEKNMFDDFLNPDGKTYNGLRMLSVISGLSEDEIRWSEKRLRKLIVVQGMKKDAAIKIVTQEGKSKPWEL